MDSTLLKFQVISFKLIKEGGSANEALEIVPDVVIKRCETGSLLKMLLKRKG